ncbi:RagB/SusD family nutrient uptake outer membrane protein [Dokdonia sp. PRO95]|uniref:RagB/SusD family nutrient uptake outer membrane protein n=1 Tax=Dokdonia sp. PRO95 TaxID=1239415 RepID=UPI000555304D|nr:RagB/SusD family nutrient uptake outer membrane protein [Dokdonia sp. PRO95]
MKQKMTVNNFKRLLALGVLSGVLLTSCTDLEIEATDSIFLDANDSTFQGIEDPSSFLDGVYNSINGFIGDQTNLFALSEVTTDAALIPTRGADWGDNGQWRQLHEQTWPTDHNFILGTWNQWNGLQFQASQVLSDLTEASPELKANASFLRALGTWVILDNYGQVPIRDVTGSPIDDPIVLRGAEAVDLIVSDLTDAINGLPLAGPGSGNTRPEKAGARYLLAKVLLNKHVYLGTQPDPADMAQVVTLVDAINAEGYDLVGGYFDIFRPELDNETIWFLQTGVGNRIYNGLHYNSTITSGGGWNGFSTLAEYYDLFEGDPNINVAGSGQEERRGMVPLQGLPVGSVAGANGDDNGDGFIDGSSVGRGFLIGQQYADDGTALSDRVGNPLTFKREFQDAQGNTSLIGNDETTGIRVTKYSPMFDGGFTNHEIYFRYSDAHLMKAEALFRAGDTGSATALVNELRVLREATPIGSVTAQDIIDERGRELYAELWRRNDLIRFGQYTNDWTLKSPSAVGDTSRNLFPIPASQLLLNPNLTQNPGY